MLFSDVIGQKRTKDFLNRLRLDGRVPHALLLAGTPGSGALPLALAYAQQLQCENPGAEDACNTCNACRKAAQCTHPDIHFSFPTVGANAVSTQFLKEWREAMASSPYQSVNDWLQRLQAENKQGNITKDECHAIVRKLSLKVFEGRYKILLMWLPEYLGNEGNRLLKLIEEPPEQTIFLLVAENPDKVLNTILSRCQLVKLDTLQDEDIAATLSERLALAPDRARHIAFMAGGDYQAALTVAENPENNDAALLLDWLRKCWKGNGVELVRWTDQFAKLGRENQKQFLQYSLHFIRELTAFVVTGNQQLRLGPEELGTALNMAKVLDFDKLSRMAELLNDHAYYIERNANPKILFLDASLQVHSIMNQK